MAVLNSAELAELRNSMASDNVTVSYTKAQINAALQAIEDWFEANRSSLGNAIDAAAPGAFPTNARKKRLVAYWLLQKFRREGI